MGRWHFGSDLVKMDILTQTYKRDGNAKVHSLYFGVSPLGGTVTTIVKKHPTEDRLEKTRVFGPPMERGAGGRAMVLVLGGMETTLDEIEDILAMAKAKPFKPQRTSGEIAAMCEYLRERRNEAIREAQKTAPAEPKKKRTINLSLRVGSRRAKTGVPGLRMRVKG